MYQSLYVGGWYFHEEPIALHAADDAGKDFSHQGFGLASLGHGHHIRLQFGQEATATIQLLHQSLQQGFLGRVEQAGGQQRPIDLAVVLPEGYEDTDSGAAPGTDQDPEPLDLQSED